MNAMNITVVTRTVEVKGVELPWERIELFGCDVLRDEGSSMFPDREPTGTVVESGTVFVPLDTLYDLSEQDVWGSTFGNAFLLPHKEGLALVAAGLAVQENRGGFHRTDKLVEFLDELG